ncbi:hypothetical protein AG1IA_10179 [Rhizoctonia solani AG-1 IA]|uniref:Uncharacterized protein n=1 Tax=Thanatephorus cucumeris (strain AG1-IA) TaxID=983506 RepID=L8WCB4_THACA|nr:hypothetical protein AG1IA_10179 [Rhizoctonia solani AG-1 IA]
MNGEYVTDRTADVWPPYGRPTKVPVLVSQMRIVKSSEPEQRCESSGENEIRGCWLRYMRLWRNMPRTQLAFLLSALQIEIDAKRERSVENEIGPTDAMRRQCECRQVMIRVRQPYLNVHAADQRQ